MFKDVKKFNQDISQWNTANVTNMSLMFSGAASFNQDISHWKTANVANMSGMFNDATSFNQNISNWNISRVIKYDDFSKNSGITNPNQLPKFEKINNDNQFEVNFRFWSHNLIKVKISYYDFKNMKNIYSVKNKNDVKKFFHTIIENFPRIDNTGIGGSILQSDYTTAVAVIINHFDEIKDFFAKLQTNHGLLIITNRISSWDKNDNMGVFSQ